MHGRASLLRRTRGRRCAPFTVNNLGLQMRYRYEIGPLSELFLVYARGGFDLLDDDDRGVGDLFRRHGRCARRGSVPDQGPLPAVAQDVTAVMHAAIFRSMATPLVCIS